MNPLLASEISKIKTEDRDEFIDKLISGWEFYLPVYELTERILKLNDQMGDEYFRERYWNLQKNNKDKPIDPVKNENEDAINENLNDPLWHKGIFNRIKSVMFHDEVSSSNFSYKEEVTLFRKYISERVYNHLAMLTRSSHAKKGGAFSLRDDFALEIAGKIGLGLYFSDRVARDKRAEIESVLTKLAEDFEEWFIDKKLGHFSATFGEVVSFERRNENYPGNKLILINDVRNKNKLVA